MNSEHKKNSIESNQFIFVPTTAAQLSPVSGASLKRARGGTDDDNNNLNTTIVRKRCISDDSSNTKLQLPFSLSNPNNKDNKLFTYRFASHSSEIIQQQMVNHNTNRNGDDDSAGDDEVNGGDGGIAQKKNKTTTASQLTNCFLEISIRSVLFIIFVQLERSPAFKRKIHSEELWLYKYPPTKDYVPASILMPASFILPFLIICIKFLLTHDKYDFIKSINVISLAIPLNGLLTSLLKITVGRPRPDYYYRCFPDGVMMMMKNNSDDDDDDVMMNCTGDERIVNEGRKSFPSGHSSFAFAGFGFIFLYLAAKLNCFNDRGRGQTWRLCLSLTPLFIALLVAISRTCDYHHHWQDVLIGSLIGFFITYISYRQYYPSIFSLNCHRPYGNNGSSSSNKMLISGKCYVPIKNDCDTTIQNDQIPLIQEEKDTKWI